MVTGLRSVALHKTVLVNLDTGRAFRGALLQARRDVIVLGNAAIVEPGSDPVPVSGTVVLERSRVEFVQVVN